MKKLIRIPRRLSLQALFILVGVACVYFAAWGPTKRYAASQITKGRVEDVEERNRVSDAKAVAPLIVRQDEYEILRKSTLVTRRWVQRYYVWCLGPTIRLPYESVEKSYFHLGMFSLSRIDDRSRISIKIFWHLLNCFDRATWSRPANQYHVAHRSQS